MTTTTLNVPDISCGHCKSSIEGAVGGDAAGATLTLIRPGVLDPAKMTGSRNSGR